MRIVGFIAIVVLLTMATQAKVIFFNLSSILIVIGFTIAALLLAGVSIPNMFKAIFSGQATPQELLAGARGWARARIYIVVAGIIGTFIGALLTLENLDAFTELGPRVAVCLLCLFYGVIMGYGIFLPLQHRLEDRAREQES